MHHCIPQAQQLLVDIFLGLATIGACVQPVPNSWHTVLIFFGWLMQAHLPSLLLRSIRRMARLLLANLYVCCRLESCSTQTVHQQIQKMRGSSQQFCQYLDGMLFDADMGMQHSWQIALRSPLQPAGMYSIGLFGSIPRLHSLLETFKRYIVIRFPWTCWPTFCQSSPVHLCSCDPSFAWDRSCN